MAEVNFQLPFIRIIRINNFTPPFAEPVGVNRGIANTFRLSVNPACTADVTAAAIRVDNGVAIFANSVAPLDVGRIWTATWDANTLPVGGQRLIVRFTAGADQKSCCEVEIMST